MTAGHIAARYADDGSIQITAPVPALRDLADRLVQGMAEEEWRLDADPAPSGPYPHAITSMALRPGTDRVRFSRQGDRLVISANPEARRRLADDLRSLAKHPQYPAEASVRPHLHFDYFPDHPRLAPGSEEVVVVLVL